MLRPFQILLSTLVAAALTACSPAPSGPLQPEDFRLGPAHPEMSVEELRAALGEPKSVERSENPYSPGSRIVTWRYDDLDVTLVDGQAVLGIALTGPGRRTARGLRVGDAAGRARELYGEPAGSLDEIWDYADPNDESGLRVLRVEMKQGRVASIYLGHLLD